ncbi:unnamed protein product [Boreogadus saida]
MVNNVNHSVCRHVFGTALTCTLGPRRGESFSNRWRYASRTQARSAKDPRQDGPSVNGGGGYCRQEEEQNRVGGNKATLECLEPPFSSLPSPSSMAKVTAPPPSDADLLSTLLMTDLQFPFGKTQCDDYRLLYSFPFSM